MKDIFKTDKKERADRTYQRIVYMKLCALRVAVQDARNNDVDCGIVSELDFAHLITQLRKIGDMGYVSLMESGNFTPPALPSVEQIEGPVFDINDGVEV